MKIGSFIPNIKWTFADSTMGKVFSPDNKHIGFYEDFHTENMRLVFIYTNHQLMMEHLDNEETERFGEPIPIKEVRDFVKKTFNIKGDDNVFWWDFEDYICNVDGGSVPSLCENIEGWADWINSLETFGGVKFDSTIESQVNWSKGIY
jgi:hypothetical protein